MTDKILYNIVKKYLFIIILNIFSIFNEEYLL
jgi:hypothetical protein